MAANAWARHFLVLLFTFSMRNDLSTAINTITGTCSTRIDLSSPDRKIYSGILEVPMPASFYDYQDPRLNKNCDIQIMFNAGMMLQLDLYYLDIVPVPRDGSKCSTGLEVLDQSGKNLYGKRLCMEGWEWEETHRNNKMEKRSANTSPVIFRLVSEGKYTGNGFKVHFNELRQVSICESYEFQCTNAQGCINYDLTCDGWDDCKDGNSDEREEAGCGLLTESEIGALLIGILLFLGTVAVLIFFFYRYARLQRRYNLNKSISKMSIAHTNVSENPQPLLMLPNRYNSQESMMNKSVYSRSSAVPRMGYDNDSVIDKNCLEKADRFSLNMSEKSYRSNPRRPRPSSQTPEPEPLKKNGHYDRRSISSLQKESKVVLPNQSQDEGTSGRDSEKDSRDFDRDYRDKKYRDRDYRDRDYRYRDREQRSDSDDSERDYRRRRSSRDRYRRRDDRSSEDDDYDSDYDRRRSRRRRSRDRYSRDYYDDSDYERDRRRSSRSRERYYNRNEDENSDSRDDEESDRPIKPRHSSQERRRRRRDDYDDDDDYPKKSRNRRRRRYSDDDDDEEDEEHNYRSKHRGSSRDRDRDRVSSRERERDRDPRRREYDDDEARNSPRSYNDNKRRSKSREKLPQPEHDYAPYIDDEQRNAPRRNKSREKLSQPGEDYAPPRYDDSRMAPRMDSDYNSRPKSREKVSPQEHDFAPPPATPPPSDVVNDGNRLRDNRTRRNNERNRQNNDRNRQNNERNRQIDDRSQQEENNPSDAQGRSQWKPRAEREKYSRNRRNRGDADKKKEENENYAPPVYEDVVTHPSHRNQGYKEEAV